MEDIWQKILIRRDTGQRGVELKVSNFSYWGKYFEQLRQEGGGLENVMTDFRLMKFEMTVGSQKHPYIYIY